MSRSDTTKLTGDEAKTGSNAKTSADNAGGAWFTQCTCHDQIDTGVLAHLERLSHEESREDLEAELNDLMKHEEQNDALLGALSCTDDSDSYNLVANGLLDKTRTRKEIFSLLMAKRKASASHQEADWGQVCSVSKGTSGAGSNIGRSPSVCPHCNQQDCVSRAVKETEDVTKIEGSDRE
ncbi:hypothetical protein ACCO45_012780 [Purpureocillium lilacinum]|uniref:Uncharacterized protein n=1 Tax=Purpureocillium lilacinum TaxID=33203 RepID=A0ACC4D8Z1_PURLI